MGNSLVRYEGCGFWANDCALLAWLAIVAGKLREQDPNGMSDWRGLIARSWEIEDQFAFPGGVFPRIDGVITNEVRRSALVQACEASVEWLNTQGSVLTEDTLNSLVHPKIRWSGGDVEVDHILAVATRFLALLNGVGFDHRVEFPKQLD